MDLSFLLHSSTSVQHHLIVPLSDIAICISCFCRHPLKFLTYAVFQFFVAAVTVQCPCMLVFLFLFTQSLSFSCWPFFTFLHDVAGNMFLVIFVLISLLFFYVAKFGHILFSDLVVFFLIKFCFFIKKMFLEKLQTVCKFWRKLRRWEHLTGNLPSQLKLLIVVLKSLKQKVSIQSRRRKVLVMLMNTL